jgi:predicted dehydrogenase
MGVSMATVRRPLRLGFVGAGFVGQLAHIDNYAQLEDCEIVALAELRPELRRKVCERYGIARGYATHEELLADPEVDAVVVVTARPMMPVVAYDCLAAGKHVITEKPMAHTVEQAEKLVAMAREKGVIYAVGYMKRFDEGVERAKELAEALMASGELGRVIHARARCFMGESYCNIDGHVVTDEAKPAVSDRPVWPEGPDWLPPDKIRPYAWFINVYAHNINLLRHLAGATPTADYAWLGHIYGQVAVLNFGDFVATLEAGQYSYRGWDEVTELSFEKGFLRVETPPSFLRNISGRVTLYRGGEEHVLVQPQLPWSWAFRRQAQAFVTAVLEGREPLNSGADALEDIRLAEAIWRKGLGI